MIDTSKPVDRTGNPWCGPLVAAAILGTSTGIVAERIYGMRKARDPACRHKRVTKIVRGTFHTEIHAVLTRAGFTLESVDVGARYVKHRKSRAGATYCNPDFSRMVRPSPIFWVDSEQWHAFTLLDFEARPLWALRSMLATGTHIVHTPKHYAIAHAGMWCETHTLGAWVPLRAAPSSNRKVLQAWRVTAPGV